MRSDGTAERIVHGYDSGGGSAPTWSPDGSKLAFLNLNTFTPGLSNPSSTSSSSTSRAATR